MSWTQYPGENVGEQNVRSDQIFLTNVSFQNYFFQKFAISEGNSKIEIFKCGKTRF